MKMERSRSFMEDVPERKKNKLIATMPSIQGEIEAEARRSQSLDFSNGVVDPYLDVESKLTYHEETWTFTLFEKLDYLVVSRITPEEVIAAREKNRKKSISRDLLLDRYEASREFRRS